MTRTSGQDKLNLIKLSVGTESVEGLARWHRNPRSHGPDGLPRHVTRMWPRREAEILDGGSIFWVIRGQILCRSPIRRFDEVTGSDGIRRCAIVLDPEPIPVTPAPRRPFQGWRYLPVEASPPDLRAGAQDNDTLPHDLQAALAEIGVR